MKIAALVVCLLGMLSIGWLMYFTPIDRKPIAEQVDSPTALITTSESNLLNQASSASDPYSAELPRDWIYDDTDPVDFYSIGSIQRFLIYPATPYEAYRKHIRLAEQGNASSMYLLSKVFYECRLAPASREMYEKSWLNNAGFEKYWGLAEYQLERCEELRSQFDRETDFYAQEDYWLHRSAEAGLLTARAELLMKMMEPPFEEDPFYEELVQVIEKATQTEGYPAYYQMAGYLESLRDHSFNDFTSYAWRFAGCKLHRGCDHQKALQLTTADMLEPRIDEFLELVRSIEKAHPVK